MTLREAVERAIKANRHKIRSWDLSCAVQYLETIDVAYRTYGPQGVRIQLLYALSNLTGWRGEEAREVKAILKKEAEGSGPLPPGDW